MVASFAGQVEAVRFLLDVAHFPLEERDSSLRTPIHLATKSGSIAVVRLLLERGADPDRMDEAQRTALTYAAAAHNVSLLSCLLDGGADPDVTDQSLRTCLHYLSEGGHSHCGGGRGGRRPCRLGGRISWGSPLFLVGRGREGGREGGDGVR